MNSDKTYLVYSPETDSLNLNKTEIALISELARIPEQRYSKTIRKYFSEAQDKHLFLNRLDEIFLWYYKTSRPVIHPFSGMKKAMEFILEIISGIEHELNSKSKASSAKHITEYTQHQIALSLYYKHAAGIDLWDEGKKLKELEKIAKMHSKSTTKLQKAYNEFALPGTEQSRLKFLAELANQNALTKLLDGHKAAISELNREIIKSKVVNS